MPSLLSSSFSLPPLHFQPHLLNPNPNFISIRSPPPSRLLISAAKQPRPRRPRRDDVSATVFVSSVGGGAGREEGVGDLEEEIYEFMRWSGKPESFPTRAELIAAGRADIAASVASRGGWLAFGWDLDDEQVHDKKHQAKEANGILMSSASHSDSNHEVEKKLEDYKSMELAESGAGEEKSGVEGMLSRLESERRWLREARGRRARERGGENGVVLSHGSSSYHSGTGSRDMLPESGKGDLHNPISFNLQNRTLEAKNVLTNSTCNMWRSWSLNNGGFSDFEAAEIHPTDSRKLLEHDNQNVDSRELDGLSKIAVTERHSDKDNIHSRLQHLESNLSSALRSFRSRFNSVLPEKSSDTPVSELDNLIDDWEFQETMVMNTQDELRSIRAKIAVLEGKMALDIIEKQKIIDDKQRRLEAAEKALNSLRTVYIVWPNSASEVLLAGSFDGWTNKKSMERSKGGMFSLNLRLYPGRYEIKFIVDGVWKVDPLRPVVNNNGHENNLLIVP